MKDPSNQMQLDTDERGAELMDEARDWVESHPTEWDYYMELARRFTRESGYASANLCLNTVRCRYRVKIKNCYSPCFSRIAMEQDDKIRFRMNRSMVDGFTEAVL